MRWGCLSVRMMVVEVTTNRQELTMTEHISPLRLRMIEDMTIRNLSPTTQGSYIHAVKKFSLHLGRSPDCLGIEDVRAYQIYLVSSGRDI